MTASIAREASNQERVFGFLMGLATDPPVHRIDTHAAAVFLAGSRALKVKRAVHFAFLD
jgi:aminoglycoside phosphotransferase family enzyme